MSIEDREFSSDDVIYWRDKLEQRRKLFVEAREILKKHALKDLSSEETGEISKMRLHPADLATQTQDSGTYETLLSRNIQMTQSVEDALSRLESGAFGICISCGEPISRSRLEAIPETPYCLNCQMDQEEINRVSKKAARDYLFQAKAKPEVVEAMDALMVSDVMQTELITVRSYENFDVAVQLMSDNKIRHLPVLDKRGDLEGILSDRDLLGVVFRIRPSTTIEDMTDFWSKLRISNIMTKTPDTVNPETSLREAGLILLDNNISCLPVVEGNRLVGILTERDFVKLVSQSR